MEFNRQKTLNLILKEEYGFIPPQANENLTFNIEEETVINNIYIRKIAMLYRTYKMRSYLYVPNDNKKHKAFVFVLHEYAEETAKPDLVNDYQSLIRYVPVDLITSRGFAVLVVVTREVAPDKKYSHRKSVIKYMKTKKTNDSWGALQAWSWACRKGLDYLYTLPNEIDLDNVAVIGHSRGGKTALLAAAQDERFAMAVSSCSGNSGAALARNNTGETINVITHAFPYWFCKNYKKYANNEERLPFDQHQLIGCIAPRLTYVFSANQDDWACPKNELESCRKASKFYKEYGVNGLIAPDTIKEDVSYNEGNIAYHIKTGTHCIEPRDWNMVMDYFIKQRGE